MTLEELIAFDKTLAPLGEGGKPEARWMPWDAYIYNAKRWNKKHPEDLCYLPEDEKEDFQLHP